MDIMNGFRFTSPDYGDPTVLGCKIMLKRRNFLAGTVAATATVSKSDLFEGSRARLNVEKRIMGLETGEARLGVCFLDTATQEYSGTRMDERFAMCSTFKLAMVGCCLREADSGDLDLSEFLPFGETDIQGWAPVTSRKLAQGGMTIGELAKAAVQLSDATAANLLVCKLGGPAAVTRQFRAMGDPISRLDRYEPRLGMVLSADMRDTTSPFAMAGLISRLTTGPLLEPISRKVLIDWMSGTQTGINRLRAGLPIGWRVGNKTGSGRAEGTTNKCNDIAIAYPPGRSPIIISAYFDSGEYTERIEARHEAVLAEIGSIASEWAMA